MWDLFLMKKLIKNEIYGSMNSAYVYCSLQKVNICGYCSLNSNRNTPKRVKTKKKKKKKRTKRSLETQTWNPNTHSNSHDQPAIQKEKETEIEGPFGLSLLLLKTEN